MRRTCLLEWCRLFGCDGSRRFSGGDRRCGALFDGKVVAEGLYRVDGIPQNLTCLLTGCFITYIFPSSFMIFLEESETKGGKKAVSKTRGTVTFCKYSAFYGLSKGPNYATPNYKPLQRSIHCLTFLADSWYGLLPPGLSIFVIFPSLWRSCTLHSVFVQCGATSRSR